MCDKLVYIHLCMILVLDRFQISVNIFCGNSPVLSFKNKIYEFVHDEFVHDMEALSALLALCVGNPPVDSHHKGPLIHSFDGFFVISLDKLQTGYDVMAMVSYSYLS